MKTMWKWCAVALLPLGAASAGTILAGDMDGFAGGDTADVPNLRPPFDDAMAWEANNNDFHGGTPREFDENGFNHAFGNSFTGIAIGSIDLSQPVTLEIMMRSQGGAIDSTDAIGFQLDDATVPGAYPGPGYFPSMRVGFGLPGFVATHGDGAAPATGVTTTIDLRTVNIATLSETVAENINNVGHLDVFISDDTGIDWMRLSYTEIPEPASAMLLTLGAIALLRRR